MSVKSSKDVHFGAHQAGCVTREVGDLVASDGGLRVGLGFSVVVDDLVEAFGVSFLSSNEDNMSPDNSCRVLESLGWCCAECFSLFAPLEAPRLGDQGLLSEILLVVELARGLVNYGTRYHPPIPLAKLSPEHVLSGESLQVTRSPGKNTHVIGGEEGDDVE
jgi:hypothetical protein